MERTIGQGGFGKVKLAIHKETGEQVAIKIIEKSKISQAFSIGNVNNEVDVLSKLSHPNIAKLYQVIENSNYLYLVLEHCYLGDLNAYIVKKKRLDEFEAIRIFDKLLDVINYLHTRKIAHRDLKLENLMLGHSKNLKVIDFGLSKRYGDCLLTTSCGTPVYCPPEMLVGQPYGGLEADLWSAGITLYVMLCGYFPFQVVI